jgi:flagellar FliJ protein
MKKFDFRLQPLLKYRKYLERVAQQNTARAYMDVENCDKQISHLTKVYGNSNDRIKEEVVKGISAIEFKRYYKYLDSVESSIAEEKLNKLELKKVLNETLLELKKKSVDKKAMELYREKLRTIYSQEMIKLEQKDLDEISSLKTARKLSNDSI